MKGGVDVTEKNNMIWSSSSAPTDADLLKFITDYPEECLQYRNPDGSIDLDGVRIEMEKSRRSIVLDNYIDRIGKLNGKTDKRYYIKLKNPNKKDGRQTLKAPTKEGLLEKIYEWHVTHVEHGHDYVPKEEVTLALLFSEFLEHKRATTWSPSTETKNISIWNNHYEGTDIINVPLQEIRLKHLQEWALDSKGWHIDGSGDVYDISTLNDKEYYETLFYKERWDPTPMSTGETLEQRIIVTFSFKYKEYLSYVRERQVERAKALLVKGRGATSKKKSPNDAKRYIMAEHCTLPSSRSTAADGSSRTGSAS